jgi:2Fe-2S ferredoxin
MPFVTVQPSGNRIEAASGASLLSVLLSAGEPIPHKCDGKAECGSCHLFVHDGRKTLSKMTAAENARLDAIVGVGSKSRLACQALLGADDVTVELLGFGSGL